MKIKNMQITKFVIGLTLTLGLISCNSDDDQAIIDTPPLSYDSQEHIYGTTQFFNIGEWEIVIDPSTGQYDTIPGTKRAAGGFSLPLGTTRLTSFDRNQRIFINKENSSELILQDLQTYEYTTIDLMSQNTNQAVLSPQFLTFGNSENELYLLDADESLWTIDLDSKVVEKIHDNIIPSNNFNISNIFYIKASDDFLLMTQMGSQINELILFDKDSAAIIDTKTIEESFGFVQYPSEDRIYYLQLPTLDKGFRLMELQVSGGNIITEQKSATDLAINSLSPYLQTIHTATDSYICRAGSSSIEMPTNFLYTINLGTGELVSEVSLDESGIITNVSGE